MHLPCSLLRPRPRPPARTFASLACAGALLGLLGCGDDRVLSPADSSSSSGDGAPGEATGSTSTSGSSSAGTTSSSTTAADDTSVGSSEGALFFAEPDLAPDECSTYAQDCPPGQKCTAWANDGGKAWNALRCAPVVDDPVGPGEPCHVEGSGTSGLDDCARGSLCFRVDPKTMEGVCFPFCLGSEQAPTCEDPGRACHQGSDGALNLCLPVCDPLAQDCGAGEACYPIGDHWSCGADDSGDAGAYGDPCEFINRCDPWLLCLDPGALPPGLPCEGASGCCTEVCDLADPLGDMQCTGAAEGVICQAWYEEGAAPPGYEQVGACALPL